MKKSDVAIKCVFSILYSCILTLSFCYMTVFNLNTFLILSVGAVVSFACFLIFNLKKGNIIYPIIFACLIVLAVGIYIFSVLSKGENLLENFNHIINLIVGYEKISNFDLNLIFVGLSVFVSMTCVLLIGRKVQFVLASLCALIVMFCAMLTASAARYKAFIMMLSLLCVMWLYSVYLKHNTLKNSTKMKGKNAVVILIAIVLLVPVIFVSEKTDNLNDEIFSVEMLSKDYYERNGEDQFSLGTFVTTTKSDELGGDRITDKKTALTVNSTYPFYISFIYKDYYDSKSWQVSDIRKTLCVSSDDINLDAQIKSYVFSRAGYNIYENDVSIEYEELVTRNYAVSTDIYTRPKQSNEKDKIYCDNNNNLFSNEMLKKGFVYQFSAVNYDLNEVYEFLGSEKYNKSASTVSDIISNAEYNAYLEQLHYKYTQIPKTMPVRVDHLSYEIVEKANAETTIEKVQAFIDYLSDYEYTLKGAPLKDGEDFVDKFLFEYKKGYCTSFASALTMLCRTQEIPARYCEGFAPNDEAGEYVVTNDKMHAWTEVYFDGFGWVIFEATPHYSDSITYVATGQSEENAVQPGITQAAEETEKQPTKTQEENNKEEINAPSFEKNRIYVKFVVIGLVALTVLALVLLIIINLLKDKAIYKKDNKGFVIAAYKKIILLIRFSKIKTDKNDTVKTALNKAGIFDTRPFEKAMYSNAEIDNEDRKKADNIYQTYKKCVYNNHSKFKYFIYKFILNKL